MLWKSNARYNEDALNKGSLNTAISLRHSMVVLRVRVPNQGWVGFPRKHLVVGVGSIY